MDMYDSAYENWCNDCGDIWMPPPRLRPLCESVSRSLDEIMELEVRIIQSCTDLEPATWIAIYWEKFRKIVDEDSSGTESQIKRKLYFNE
jgi:hypothetical protein